MDRFSAGRGARWWAVVTMLVMLTAGDALAQARDAARVEASQALFEAVQANDMAGAQASVANGADVKAQDSWGLTPIDVAVDRGFYDIAHFLLAVRNTRREVATRPSGRATAVGSNRSRASTYLPMASTSQPAAESRSRRSAGGTAAPETTLPVVDRR